MDTETEIEIQVIVDGAIVKSCFVREEDWSNFNYIDYVDGSFESITGRFVPSAEFVETYSTELLKRICDLVDSCK